MSELVYPEKMLNDKNAWIWMPKYRRLMLNQQQFNCVFCAKPGSGKSWTALAVAELFDPDFVVRESVCFDAESFAKRVSDYSLKRGSILVLDDAGLSLANTDFLQKEVKSICKTLQSIRHRGFVVLLTLPSFSLLVKGARLLIDHYCEPMGIDYTSEEAIVKFQNIQHNPLTGKLYRSNLLRFKKFVNPVTGLTTTSKEKILSIRIKRPSKRITDEYALWKQERMREFDKFNADEISSVMNKRKAKVVSTDSVRRKVEANRDAFVLNGRVSHELIMKEFRIGITRARSIARMVNNPS